MYSYNITRCILCLTKGTLSANLKPPTAGARILSVDGGGIRGVVPLEYLNMLQNLLGPTVRVQELFEVAFGTSSGTQPLRLVSHDRLRGQQVA